MLLWQPFHGRHDSSNYLRSLLFRVLGHLRSSSVDQRTRPLRPTDQTMDQSGYQDSLSCLEMKNVPTSSNLLTDHLAVAAKRQRPPGNQALKTRPPGSWARPVDPGRRPAALCQQSAPFGLNVKSNWQAGVRTSIEFQKTNRELLGIQTAIGMPMYPEK